MGRPRAEEAKREEIIATALRLFGEQGIRRTTIRDIAAEAGVSSGALYKHFDSKLDLANALFAACADRLTARLGEARDGVNGDPCARLRSVVAALLEFSREEPDAYNYLLEHHHAELAGLPAEAELPKDVIEQVLRAGVRAGDFASRDPGLDTALIIGMCQRATFFYDRGLVESSWRRLVARITGAAALLVDCRNHPGKDRS